MVVTLVTYNSFNEFNKLRIEGVDIFRVGCPNNPLVQTFWGRVTSTSYFTITNNNPEGEVSVFQNLTPIQKDHKIK